jgi:dihydroflavonol-4-reductase
VFSWQGRRVAITGATGFVGLHAAKDLRTHGADVVALVRATSDIRYLSEAEISCRVASLDDTNMLAEVLRGCDVVVHSAGAVGFEPHWDEFIRVNVDGTRNLFKAARLAGVRRVVHTSSIVAVGGTKKPIVLDEAVSWNLKSCRVPYVTTKRWAEEAAMAENGNGLEVVVVNPGSVIGPNDFAGSEFGTLIQRFWSGWIPFHFGGGNNYVDVRDVAQGIRLAAEIGRPGERYLLVGENRSFQQFYADLCRTAARRIPFVRLPSALAPIIGLLDDRLRRRGTRRPFLSSVQAKLMGLFFYFDGSKARRELGFNPRPLNQTLADSYEFWTAGSSMHSVSA